MKKSLLYLIPIFIIIISCSNRIPENNGFTTYTIIFNNIANLKIGDSAKLDNNNIGLVTSINLLKNQVEVKIDIETNISIFKGSKIENLIDENGTSYIKITYPVTKNEIIEPESILFGITKTIDNFKL